MCSAMLHYHQFRESLAFLPLCRMDDAIYDKPRADRPFNLWRTS